MGVDVIERERMRGKLHRMRGRIQQRRDGPYKCGYLDACRDALQKLDECPPVKTATIIYCKECSNAIERTTTMPYCMIHNRRKAPDDYCNFGTPDEE